MENLRTDRRSVGVNFNENGVAQVMVWAPLADRVALCVNGGGTYPLIREEYGYWVLETDRLRPGDTYRFDLDGQLRPDPASLDQPEGVHGPSRALDLRAFHWKDDTWNNLDLQNYIIYELHTGTFSASGTFSGVEEKLDHLRDLGITAIEIMPVAQFPGDRNWGYDGVFPFAVQNSYGGAAGFQHLVSLCHQKGMAVVLDVVFNHFGPEGNYLDAYGPYLTGKYATPWGRAVNFDDEWCDGVRHFFVENALMWFRDFHVDALRLDAVHAIRDFSPVHILAEIRRQTDELMRMTGRRHYLIAELDLNDPRYINPQAAAGYGLDGQWVDEFHHALRVTAGQERTGYYADFNGILHLAKAYRDAYVYDGQFSAHRKKSFGMPAVNNPGKQFVVFSQNHDQVGNRMLGERTCALVSREMQKLLAGAVICSPYLPMLFMGEEWGETSPFLYFVSHSDPELQRAVREGRKEEFRAFHASGEAPDPNDEQTFIRSRLRWELLEDENHRAMYRYYRELIRLRTRNPVLRVPDRKRLNVEVDEAARTLMLHRWHDEEHVLVLMNFSGTSHRLTMPGVDKQWTRLLCSADPEWLGPSGSPEKVTALQAVELPPESILIYTNRA
ncbi:MAG TPA: malto-oligosyltrehalose trehalohydrolase [Sphingobacteriaceae bacterium]